MDFELLPFFRPTKQEMLLCDLRSQTFAVLIAERTLTGKLFPTELLQAANQLRQQYKTAEDIDTTDNYFMGSWDGFLVQAYLSSSQPDIPIKLKWIPKHYFPHVDITCDLREDIPYIEIDRLSILQSRISELCDIQSETCDIDDPDDKLKNILSLSEELKRMDRKDYWIFA